MLELSYLMQYAHLVYLYRQISNIIIAVLGDEIVDHSDVVAASSVRLAPASY